jgi:hypothetical protein
MENYEQQPIAIQTKMRKWRWIGHAIKKTRCIHKEVDIGLVTSGARKRGRPKRAEKGLLRMKPWKQGRHGARLKDWMLTGPGGGVSRMLYAPQGATGIKM